MHPCETCMENVTAQNYDLGKVSVMENLPKAFLKRAGEAYAAKRDDEAAWYRKMADEYQEAADETRKAYDQKYHACPKCHIPFGTRGSCNNGACA